MDADWTVACGPDDPIVVVPWGGQSSGGTAIESIRYVDLRRTPEAIREIPEATRYPCLAAALQRWNRTDAPFFTAKCDVWDYPERLFDAEDLPGFACAHASYVDLLPIKHQIFSSFASCERQLRAWTDMARRIPLAASRCEFILRPARIVTSAQIAGFATTLYVWGYGPSPGTAAEAWSAALLAMVDPVLTAAKS